MKRIKCEEIQNTIQNYVKQRNLSNNNFLTKYTSTNADKLNFTPASSSTAGEANSNSLSHATIDFSLMALNDLALIESSISDYCSFSFDSLSESEYMKQFESLMNVIQKNYPNGVFDRFLYPLFVYIVIDLTTIGLSAITIIDKHNGDAAFLSKLTESQRSMIRNLLAFNNTKNPDSFPQIKEWIANKYRIEIDPTAWRLFLKAITDAKAHLLLRILNLNLQIVLTDNNTTQPSDTNTDEETDSNHHESSLPPTIKQEEVKNEKVPRTAGSIIKMEIIEKEEPLSFKSSESSSSINLSNLLNCIQNIRQSQPSRINAACCFYMDDTHDDCVTSATISPNSELLSFTTENSSTRLYKLYANNDASAGDGGRAQPRFFQELVGGHSGPIFESKFTHDSKFLISCGDDGQACLWNIHNPQVVPSNNKDTARNESEESEDYANESADETTDQDLFDFKITKATAADRGGLTEPERILPVCCYSGHTQPVWDVEPFSRLNLFATASRDATARLWSFDRVYPLRNYCGHHSDVNCVRFHPNGAYLATGSSDKTVRLWSVQSGEFVRVFPSHRSRVFSLAFSPDGNYIASSGEDRKIKVWDIRSGACVKEFKGHTDIVHALEFDNSSDVLCSGGLDRTVKFWNVHGRNVVIEPDFNSSIMKQRAAGMRGGSSAAQSASGGTAGCSSELMRSVNLGFNVYSISVDLQNVFYFLGARKSLGGSGLSQRMDQAGLIAAKKEPVHTDKPASQQRLSSSVGSMSSQTTSAGLSEATFNNNNNNNNNNGSYSTTSSSYLSTRARAKPTLTQSAATTPTNQSSSVVTPPANEESLSTKSAINTRRRAAAASASSQHQSQSQSSQSLPANSTNYLLDNDDLYEV